MVQSHLLDISDLTRHFGGSSVGLSVLSLERHKLVSMDFGGINFVRCVFAGPVHGPVEIGYVPEAGEYEVGHVVWLMAGAFTREQKKEDEVQCCAT